MTVAQFANNSRIKDCGLTELALYSTPKPGVSRAFRNAKGVTKTGVG